MVLYDYKKESTIILACILIILVFYCCYWFIKSIINKLELFSNNDSKREKMIKKFKSSNSNDCYDPDCGVDPDA